MKLDRKLLLILFAAVAFAGCKKYDFDMESKGEALGAFRLTAPATSTNLVLNSATPSDPVTISWTASKPGVNTAPTYTWILANKNGGNLDQPLIEISAGTATQLTLTQRQVDSVLAAKGIAAGVTTDFIWSVEADNGSLVQRSSDVFNITIKRMGDGVTPFRIYGPSSSTTNLEINPTSTTDSIKFYWQPAFPGVTANPVSYKLVFVNEGGDFNDPLFTIDMGDDTSYAISYKDISDSLAANGYSDPSQVARLEWTVIATSGNFSQRAMYFNKLYLARLVRMFMVGNITGWDINTAWELIADKKSDRMGRVFYTYVTVPSGGAQFLFVKERGNWNSKYGVTGGSAPTYDIGYGTGGDFNIATPGVYRLTIDIGNMKAHIQQKQVGLVGSLQGWNPASPVTGSLISRDKFLIIANMSATDEFKYHDGPVWDNSTPDKARWWGKGANDGTLDNDGNGPNVNNTLGDGLVRAIWDGTNPQQVRYELSKAQLRVVGGAPEFGSWIPDNALNMTYLGNGIWEVTVTIAASAEFKFVSSQGWSYNYGGSGGDNGTISRDGPNLNKPAGTYTIRVDEYNQTYSIL